MTRTTQNQTHATPKLPFWLLIALLSILWIAGGASRADASGQAITRFFAWAFLLAVIIWPSRREWRRVLPVATLLGLSVLLAIAHLIPLPPSLWMSLPGREILVPTAEVLGEPQPWRPLSISSGATQNSLGSLIVPVVTLLLAASLTNEQHRKIADVLLALIISGAMLAILQFSGGWYDNPFINDVQGSVSGNFANRNHFALFLAIGCALLGAWGFGKIHSRNWKVIAAVALLPIFILVLLATGSRMGLLLGGVAVLLTMLAVRVRVTRQLAKMPRRVSISLIVVVVIATISAVSLAIFMDRAISIDRAFSGEADLRSRLFPVVIDMSAHYLPIGSGLGAFDQVFRIHEPSALLQPSYFNRAHNDWLEVVLDAGLMGGALLVAGFSWWTVASYKIWSRGASGDVLPRSASIIILLVMLGSLMDYPARTPMIMAVLTLAAVWLAGGHLERNGPAASKSLHP